MDTIVFVFAAFLFADFTLFKETVSTS
jgi:hypothetical protein